MFDVWNNVLAELEKKLPESHYLTFFKDSNTSLISNKDGHIQISVPNTFMQTNICKKFDADIRAALKNNSVEVLTTEYIIATNKNNKSRETTNSRGSNFKNLSDRVGTVQRIDLERHSSLNARSQNRTGLSEKFTMDNFIIGTNNDLAVSVAKNIIENPGMKYNPFFLYGGAGLGKTHLVEAIGNELARRHPDFKILYIPINHFYNDFIQSVRNGKMDDFRRRFSELDVLIVDDFQFIVGKEKSQEEFFNIFNDMQQLNRQVIITSDRLPSQLKTVDERLASRLTQTGAYDIQFPSFEDRCAILHAKAEFNGVEIEDKAIEYIAKSVETNIRDLESMYSKVIAMADVKCISPLMVINEGMVGVVGNTTRSKVFSPSTVIETVANFFNISPEEICGRSRVAHIKTARQIAMFIMSRDLQMSTTKIANEVGLKDHTTAMHGIKKIETDTKTDFVLRDQLNEIRDLLNNGII